MSHEADNQADHAGRYGFDRWQFDAATGDLTDGEASVRLEPRVARLLGYFLTHQHTLISRDELLATVWENRVVSDDAINRGVSILRQTLSPEDRNRYIETLVRKGYISHFPPSSAGSMSEERHGRRMSGLSLAALFCVAAIALSAVYRIAGHSAVEVSPLQGSRTLMVAVLPFPSAGPGDEGEFFANGVHQDILTQLTKLQSMRVISGTSMKEYRNVSRSVREIGEELGADAILEGSVQVAGHRIRINAQLIDARTDAHIWAESYDRELTAANIFDVQSEIARAIAGALDANLTPDDRQQLSLIPTENMAAYRAYHRAMQMRDTPGITLEDPAYIEALEEAVTLDPTFSRAWAELVTLLAYLNFNGSDPALTLRAEQALDRLREVAPGSADLLIGQAAYVYYILRDYDQAHDILSRALAMQPSDVNAIQLRSWVERRQGDFDAFVQSKYEALRLDPRNPVLVDLLLEALYYTHHYDQAWAEAARSRVKSFNTAYFPLLQRFSEDGDLHQLQLAVQGLCQSYVQPDCGWEVYLANRDYARAVRSLEWPDPVYHETLISRTELRRMLTDWVMRADDHIAESVPRWQVVEAARRSDALPPSTTYLYQAILAGVQGQPDEAGRRLHAWERQKPVDRAARLSEMDTVCRVYGLIGAARSAVQCIREGLEEASSVTPFLEPDLPFYDPVRDDPAFRAMQAELQGTGHGPTR